MGQAGMSVAATARRIEARRLALELHERRLLVLPGKAWDLPMRARFSDIWQQQGRPEPAGRLVEDDLEGEGEG